MFTGIVEECGRIEAITPQKDAIQMLVRSKVCGHTLKSGASLAVNGCCLTATKITGRGRERLLQFDLLQETWNKTNFHAARTRSGVNLERAVQAGGRMDGHFVTGHIDGLGKIIRLEKSGRDHVLDIAAPREVMRYIIYKGSIAVDGISLTVAKVSARNFRIWIIPHTLAVTALGERRVGDEVNLETDLLGKYVERFVKPVSS